MNILINNWQKRRSKFNHDWLKNDYLNSIGAFIKRLENPNPNQNKLIEFATEIFPQWEKQCQEAQWLIESFETEMSPRTLFKQPPLSQCSNETKQWAGELVHALWLVRYPVIEWFQLGQQSLWKANEDYTKISDQLKNIREINTKQLRLLLHDFRQFYNSCSHLGKNISYFLSEVSIV